MLITLTLIAALGGLLMLSDGALGVARAATHRNRGRGAPHAHLSATEPVLLHGVARGPIVSVTMPPVGLSFEYPLLAQDLGTGACPPPALVAELLRLGSPPIRLGGESQDMTVPNGALSSPPSSWEAAILYPLPADFWSQLHCMLAASNDPLTVGINVRTGQLSWAEQMVAGARSAATNGLEFSIGNEPDLYRLPNYPSLADRQTNEPAAVNLYLQLAGALRQSIGNAPLLGPDLASAEHWRLQLPRVIGQLQEQTVGVHLYPLSECDDPRAVTVENLLSPHAADAPNKLAWVVADADAAHVPAIISEANSVSCGGKAGVTDRPAAAVWAARFVLSALKTGFREVRFHFSGGAYDPFILVGDEVIDRPLESALFALKQWLPVGSLLRTVTGVQGLLATAVSGAPNGAQLILDNENARAQTAMLRTAKSVNIELLSAARAGLLSAVLPSRKGRVKLTVPANSVLAVLAEQP